MENQCEREEEDEEIRGECISIQMLSMGRIEDHSRRGRRFQVENDKKNKTGLLARHHEK